MHKIIVSISTKYNKLAPAIGLFKIGLPQSSNKFCTDFSLYSEKLSEAQRRFHDYTSDDTSAPCHVLQTCILSISEYKVLLFDLKINNEPSVKMSVLSYSLMLFLASVHVPMDTSLYVCIFLLINIFLNYKHLVEALETVFFIVVGIGTYNTSLYTGELNFSYAGTWHIRHPVVWIV